MATFFGRRYARRLEAVSRTEQIIGVVILLLVAGIIAAYVLQVVTDRNYLFGVSATDEPAPELLAPGGGQVPTTVAEAASPFPDPELPDWIVPERVEHFAPDELYQKIDGRAEAYLQHHVRGLTFGSYRHRTDPERVIDVYWYDMGTPDRALAIYRSEEAPEAQRVTFAEAGYQAGGAAFFCAGSSYVQVLSSRADDADAPAVLKIGECLAARLTP